MARTRRERAQLREAAAEMLRNGRTRKSVAATLGVSMPTLRRWFGATESPRVANAGRVSTEAMAELSAQGYTHAEIARRLGVSRPTVYGRLGPAGPPDPASGKVDLWLRIKPETHARLAAEAERRGLRNRVGIRTGQGSISLLLDALADDLPPA